MAIDFVTSFAAEENLMYAARFHQDLATEVAGQLRRPVHAEKCTAELTREARRALVAEARVLVALCSPQYYADPGCGRDWALFQHRLNQTGLSCPADAPTRVLVRWQPVEPPPPGLPMAPVIGAAVVDQYAETGLYGVARAPGMGPESEPYCRAVREIAAGVCKGHAADLPPLPEDDRPDLPPAFPKVAVVRVPKPRKETPSVRPRPRVFISYAQDEENNPGHGARVAAFANLLRRNGVEPILDQDAERRPQNWSRWMQRQCEEADFIIVIASPAYRLRAEHRERRSAVGKGVAWEGGYIWDYAYEHRETWHLRVLRVVFPEHDVEDLPRFPGSGSVSWYPIDPETGKGRLDLLLGYLKGDEE
ncbi:TIR domain-containing protein [Streptomyces dysideae]|uniref:SEFIR domain-containing protein n=1 Tax=Streptomyces dysideae TaxID=909626 RepID=A0A117S0W1_9ACTN|nr:TIR domain-containing protein [Streptomyces dysideae]KUO20225.1 hypothetical protein AQJ91_15725 [Streptomyces dysideae]